MLKYAGSHVRGINLFGNKNAWQRARGAIKRNLKVLKFYLISYSLGCTKYLYTPYTLHIRAARFCS